MRKSPTRNEPESRPISKLHSELRKHSDARKRTDLAILDIRKELKGFAIQYITQLSEILKSKYHRCTERLPHLIIPKNLQNLK